MRNKAIVGACNETKRTKVGTCTAKQHETAKTAQKPFEMNVENV